MEATIENETGLKIKCLKFDNGCEYSSSEFIDYCAVIGIKMSKTSPNTPWHNCIVEMINRTLTKKAKSMRFHVGLP